MRHLSLFLFWKILSLVVTSKTFIPQLLNIILRQLFTACFKYYIIKSSVTVVMKLFLYHNKYRWVFAFSNNSTISFSLTLYVITPYQTINLKLHTLHQVFHIVLQSCWMKIKKHLDWVSYFLLRLHLYLLRLFYLGRNSW